MSKVAFVTGISGQDGSFLAEFLLEKGYVVHGMIRRSSTEHKSNLESQKGNKNLHFHFGDITDPACVNTLINTIRPDEVYNLCAMSHVAVSFETPGYAAQVDAIGALNVLEAIKNSGLIGSCKFYQASTSEMFGKVLESPQSETTPFYPRSPYGVAKMYAHWITINYRESYDMFACCGILFNHESERRGRRFVTRKITTGVSDIYHGRMKSISLGNLNAERDWGYSSDYVRGMWMIMQQDGPSDYVLATGETHSVREFCSIAFSHIGKTLTWSGEGINEVGTDEDGIVRIRVDPQFFRPCEVELLVGDPSKANSIGWKHDVEFKELVELMVAHDLKHPCLK